MTLSRNADAVLPDSRPHHLAGQTPTPSIEVVINTHLHFDHCGGNHLFTGRPIYVQRRELDDARSEDDYTIREWVEAPGVQYVPVDAALELLPGLRLVPAPGHTRGSQVVVVETGGRSVVVGGDMAVFFAELDEPRTEGQRLVRALDPGEVWLSHELEPWRPQVDHDQAAARPVSP
ncbi:MAG: MBL fold metallo-hydrolase [Nocardioides sp.]